MSKFLLIYFTVYGLMHAYIYLRMRLLVRGSSCRKVTAVFLLLMVLAPTGVRITEKLGYADLSAVIAWIGYLWMGFAFILIAVLAGVEVCLIIARIRQRFRPVPSFDRIRLILLKAAFGGALLCTVYGFFEALLIRTEHLTIKSVKIPANAPAIRVVQISDVHVGAIIGAWRLQRMLAAVTAARPDILVATGDIVDGQLHRRNGLAEDFKRVKPQFGSYAVLGNHEFYVGAESSVRFLEEAGFRVLRREAVDLKPYLRLAGLDDSASHGWGNMAVSNEKGFLPSAGEAPYTILIKHRPAVDSASMGKFDLQLSGHVHKGQIFPFNFLTWLSFPVKAGVNRLTDGAILYVSRGTGTWGPPIRFFAPPEVTVIDILPELSS